jgi:hypothetical protein
MQRNEAAGRRLGGREPAATVRARRGSAQRFRPPAEQLDVPRPPDGPCRRESRYHCRPAVAEKLEDLFC